GVTYAGWSIGAWGGVSPFFSPHEWGETIRRLGRQRRSMSRGSGNARMLAIYRYSTASAKLSPETGHSAARTSTDLTAWAPRAPLVRLDHRAGDSCAGEESPRRAVPSPPGTSRQRPWRRRRPRPPRRS